MRPTTTKSNVTKRSPRKAALLLLLAALASTSSCNHGMPSFGVAAFQPQKGHSVQVSKSVSGSKTAKVVPPKKLQLNSTAIGVPVQQRIRVDRGKIRHYPLFQSATSMAITDNSRAWSFPSTVSLPRDLPLTPSRTTLAVAGALMAMNSGFLNGVALSGLLLPTAQGVSACTSAYTNVAVAAATSAPALYNNIFHVGAILSYMLGSCLNGALNPHGVPWDRKVPAKSLLVAAGLVGVAYTLIPLAMADASHRLVWYLLTMACGVQTSFTSMLVTGNLLRSSHLSGLTSDMGTIIGQALHGNTENLWKVPIWASIMTAFSTGGYWGIKLLKQSMGHSVLLVPLTMYLAMAGAASLRQRFLVAK